MIYSQNVQKYEKSEKIVVLIIKNKISLLKNMIKSTGKNIKTVI